MIAHGQPIWPSGRGLRFCWRMGSRVGSDCQSPVLLFAICLLARFSPTQSGNEPFDFAGAPDTIRRVTFAFGAI